MIVCRLPFSEEVFTVGDEYDTSSPITIFGFDGSRRLYFPGYLARITRKDMAKKIKNPENFLGHFEEESKADYIQNIEKAKEFVAKHQLPKLVISRLKSYYFEEKKLDIPATFHNLTQHYPNAFAYYFQEGTQAMLGAFSEQLGKFNKITNRFETMSLAGTLPVQEDWGKKEIEEQQPVTDYIKTVLARYTENVEVSETYTHPSGALKHLRTDFSAIIQSGDLEKLINDLHPTPAVCGIPKALCKEAITSIERHPRGFYAGYIRVETENDILFFVNLRCAEVYQNALLVHAGGGITQLSDPEKEWAETELKAQAIIGNLVFK